MEGKENTALKADKPLKLNVKRTMLIALSFMSISMFWQVYKSFMPLYLQSFNLEDALTGFIMSIDSILALVMLPIMGYLTDNFPAGIRRRAGRRVPLIVVGSISAAVLLILINFAYNIRNLPLMVCMLVIAAFFMNLYRTPAVSLMPDITPKRIRSGANAIINILGAVGMALALVISLVTKKTSEETVANKFGLGIKQLDPNFNNWILIGVTAGMMILVAVIFIFFVKENKFVQEKNDLLKSLDIKDEETQDGSKTRIKVKEVLGTLKKGEKKSLLFLLLSVALWYMAYNAVTTWFTSYSFRELKLEAFEWPMLVGNVAAFAMFVPATILGRKLGRKKTVLIGVAMLIAALGSASIIQFALSKSNPKFVGNFMYVVFVLVGGGWATINVHSFVMSVELANEKTNGIFTGMYYVFAFAAQAITPIISGALFTLDGNSLRLLLPYALFFSTLAFITMLFVKHGNAKDKPIIEAPEFDDALAE